MTTTPPKLPLVRKIGYIFIGLLTFAVISLAILQPIIFSLATDVPAFVSIPSDDRGWPRDDKRGALLMLNRPLNPAYPSDLVELLATTQAGVIDEKSGAHLLPTDIKAIFIQSAALGESSDYRVYRLGVQETQEITYKRQPDGKRMFIETSNGVWEPGTYIVDIPSEGMFGGRTYYQFYVDSHIATPISK